MSKRFTDTDIWKKEWFMNLKTAEKLAWFYIKDNCDNVGVWDPNFKLARFVIGAKVDWGNLISESNGNVVVMENGKWWLVDFCTFQHPDLNPESKSKPIISYISTLKRHGLWNDKQGCPKGINTLSIGYKEQEREQVKEREQEQEQEQEEKNVVVKAPAQLKNEFHAMIDQWFYSRYQYTSFGKERNAVKVLASNAFRQASTNGADAEEVVLAMMMAYEKLISGRDKFWRKQPLTPSGLMAMWDRVISETVSKQPRELSQGGREFFDEK